MSFPCILFDKILVHCAGCRGESCYKTCSIYDQSWHASECSRCKLRVIWKVRL